MACRGESHITITQRHNTQEINELHLLSHIEWQYKSK